METSRGSHKILERPIKGYEKWAQDLRSKVIFCRVTTNKKWRGSKRLWLPCYYHEFESWPSRGDKATPLFHIETRMIQHWINTFLTPSVLSVLTHAVMKDLWLLVCWGQNITAMSRIDLLYNRLNVQEKCISNNPFRLWHCYNGTSLRLPLYWAKFCLKCIGSTLLGGSLPFTANFYRPLGKVTLFTPVCSQGVGQIPLGRPPSP